MDKQYRLSLAPNLVRSGLRTRVPATHRVAKKALGISGVLTNVFSWQTEADVDKGIEKSQIDLLIDRNDNVINLCEMKFSEREYLMTEQEATKLRRRKGNFIEATNPRKAVHITLVTPYGAKQNAHTAIIQTQITLDKLFNS